MKTWHLIFNNSEEMTERPFSSFQSARKRMLAEFAAAKGGFSKEVVLDNKEATLSVGDELMHWMILETNDASPYAVVEVCGDDSDICYSDDMHTARSYLSECYRVVNESLGTCDTDEDSRRESFCIGDSAAVFHYGSGPAQMWTVLENGCVRR